MLEAVFVAVAAKVASGVDSSTVDLLKALVSSQNDQLTLLSRIDRNVDALIRGPFHAGVAHLDEASLPHRTREQRTESLNDARKKFVDALAVEREDLIRRATIEMHLGLTFLALDQLEDAEHHLELAHDYVVGGYQQLAIPSLVMRFFQDTTGRESGVWPLLGSVRELRLRLGALPTSVPVYGPSGELTSGPNWSLVLHRVEPGLAYGEETGQPDSTYWRDYAPSPRKARLWQELLGHRTRTLVEVAAGRLPKPGIPEIGMRLTADAGWAAYGDPIDITPDLERRAAADVVRERRALWPERMKRRTK